MQVAFKLQLRGISVQGISFLITHEATSIALINKWFRQKYCLVKQLSAIQERGYDEFSETETGNYRQQ